jgi:pilus assembly protein FimV
MNRTCLTQLGDALKRHSQKPGRLALTGVALAALLMQTPEAWALGLGRLSVQSALGESLKAEIDVTSLTPEEASNLKVRVAPPESYRAAGVEYNPVLPGTQATLKRRPDGRAYLSLTSDRTVQEPFVDVILELSWSTGRLVREYTLLFDPPTNLAKAPAPSPAAAPILTPAPTPAPSAQEPARTASPPAVERRPVPTRPPAVAAPAPAVAEGPATGASEYRVRPGDTLSKIAARNQNPGVSLDQMLVSLYRANSSAFIGNNMNRLKSGVVLTVPSSESTRAISSAEAREVIQAQSADFSAYRQRLAGAVTQTNVDTAPRQASGKVEASVEDRKQAAAPAPDKLTLSKGATASQVPTPEDKISKDRANRESAARVAELAKNVEDLKRLSSAASAAASATTAQAAPAPAPVAAPVPAPAPAPEVAAAPVADAPAVVASAPEIAIPAPPVAVASAPAQPPAMPVPEAESPDFVTSLLEDNPIALVVGGGLFVLLAGFGIYRLSKRARKDNGETSFLESRLQPDSFFGASGGQRIDTRDATGASSSMSYSLSQLDAIGDVDPVAEADVYLAYGRDLQAEEILKEAIRSNPDRLAIRTKLLEVYAKRRDTKGFELLATQLFSLTNGQGEDWQKAQELGSQIDPENPLYQPGGAPAGVQGDAPRMSEPLGASTMPQSVLPTPSQFNESASKAAEVDASSVDLDLDLDVDVPAPAPAPAPAMAAPAPAEPVSAPASQSVGTLDFDLGADLPPLTPAAPPPVAAQAAPAGNENAFEFDMSSISLDLDAAPPPAPAAAPELLDDFGTVDLGVDLSADEDDGRDPLERKFELAEEFRQIGDMEGARDLLQEVASKANGSLKSKAQGMLDSLA